MTVDPNVEIVRELLLRRAEKGSKKYGVTTAEAGLDLAQWLLHLREELLDGAVYITAALARLEARDGD